MIDLFGSGRVKRPYEKKGFENIVEKEQNAGITPGS